MIDLTQISTHRLIAWYLIASYGYYIELDGPMSDQSYDAVCKELMRRDVSQDEHGYLIEEDALAAGTGHQIPLSSYPNIVMNSLGQFAQFCKENSL